MPQLTITITDQQAKAMQQLIASGDYAHSSGVFSAALLTTFRYNQNDA